MKSPMSQYCYKYRCPPSCPSYDGVSAEYGRPIGVCARCGEHVYRHERFERMQASLLCANCAKDIFIRKYERNKTSKGGSR